MTDDRDDRTDAAPVHLTASTFDETVALSDGPLLVDFWAPWCAPCRAIAPALAEIARDFAGRATVAKVNVDEESELAARYAIRGIPALLFFKDGQVKDTLVGAVPKAEIVRRLDALST
ncbi:MAG TPA: thioredoxin [Candidatus Methylomirabilis sp.]|nr:thioredoxin [Candidatus Methylomirabilis sp.]